MQNSPRSSVLLNQCIKPAIDTSSLAIISRASVRCVDTVYIGKRCDIIRSLYNKQWDHVLVIKAIAMIN